MALKGIKVNGTTYQYDYDYLTNKPNIPHVPTGGTEGWLLGANWTGDLTWLPPALPSIPTPSGEYYLADYGGDISWRDRSELGGGNLPSTSNLTYNAILTADATNGQWFELPDSNKDYYLAYHGGDRGFSWDTITNNVNLDMSDINSAAVYAGDGTHSYWVETDQVNTDSSDLYLSYSDNSGIHWREWPIPTGDNGQILTLEQGRLTWANSNTEDDNGILADKIMTPEAGSSAGVSAGSVLIATGISYASWTDAPEDQSADAYYLARTEEDGTISVKWATMSNLIPTCSTQGYVLTSSDNGRVIWADPSTLQSQ